MNAGLGIHISQNQQMSLTPKMVEELKILQMSNVELLKYIDMQLCENPILETEDENTVDFELTNNETLEEDEGEYGEFSQGKDFTEYTSSPLTLKQHLISQVRELCIDTEIRKIALYLIESINDDGYLVTSVEDTSRSLSVSVDKVKKSLRVVQSLEPLGVGARNIKECVLLQLNRSGRLNSTIKAVVINFLELLAEKKYKIISDKLKITVEQVMDIHQKIKSTDPKPGLRFCGNAPARYIKPELVVKLIDDKFIVFFNNDSTLNLNVSEYYKRLIKSEESSIETKKYIKSRITKAMEIINAIEQRNKTVLNVASSIVEYQEDFLRKGHMFLKPLTLKMVADKVGRHESTISRTINEKYIETPRGVFELKFFFSTQVVTTNDNCVAANAVKKVIRDIIQNEDKKSPLSDEQIRKILEDRNIRLARRTVAKYRDEMSILPAKMRGL